MLYRELRLSLQLPCLLCLFKFAQEQLGTQYYRVNEKLNVYEPLTTQLTIYGRFESLGSFLNG